MGRFFGSVGEQLTLFVQQLAWLNTAPDKRKGDKKDARLNPTRRETLFKQGAPIHLPDNPAPHITDWLIDIGPIMGDDAIGWRDMTAWQELTGIALQPWEAREIRRLSKVYINQYHDARAPDCPAPWAGAHADIVSNRDRVNSQVRAVFSGMRKVGSRRPD
ncbi:hypothetical protein [Novosphingobium sp. KN65.2]|uniref:hypothetical protein n=1 Tax=Novosphingobium sp. KN65.2 TaxID=1478134 RepID=UPI0005EA0E9D|nr:hypothetical protein [Novosphingobium sp. KN65.2]CDO34994.1 conserved hypothetical protein [Novosphingobium sp. KN65.2]